MFRKIIIAAVSQNGVIGKDGKIPWNIREEMKHFRLTTTGWPVIMGRKTFESLKGPLKNRLNIVITKNPRFRPDDPAVLFFNSLQQAYDYCSTLQTEKVFIIGGGELYSRAINDADILLISYINSEFDGDVFFPLIDPVIWKETGRVKYEDFHAVRYERIKKTDL